MMNSIDDFQVLNAIGKGGFASVYRARCLSTGQDVAIKMVDKNQMNATGMAGRVRQEVAIHSRLKHPSILELLAFFEDENYVYLVLELCENGELARFLKQSPTLFSESEARTVFQQVVSGLLYLHSHGIMHRDLTLANIMLTSQMNIKIGDFGLATQVTSPGERHMTMCGTPNFISPEVATRSSHGLEADIWGLGCLLYTMLVGRPPFDTTGVRSTLTKVVMADFSLPEWLSLEVRDLISSMLRKNPLERIKLRDIPSHPWLRISPQGQPSSQSQDSGMYTMTTTGFSAGSNSLASANNNRPGPRPMQAFPLLPVPEYSEENELAVAAAGRLGQQPPRLLAAITRSEPMLNANRIGEPVTNRSQQLHRLDLHPSSPPVKMRSDPQDLPAPLLPIKSKISSLSFPSLDQQEPARPDHNRFLENNNTSGLSSRPANNNRSAGFQTPSSHAQQPLHGQISDPSRSMEVDQQRSHYSESALNLNRLQLRPGSSQGSLLEQPGTENVDSQHKQSSQQLRHQHQHQQQQHQDFQQHQLQQNQQQFHHSQQHYQQQQQQRGQYEEAYSEETPAVALQRIEDVVQPLNTERLRPTRQKTKNAVANILSNGEVCLEFTKTRCGEELVIDVVRISGDGERIVVYNPGGPKSRGVPVASSPPPIPQGGADAFYSYQSLPNKLWKKYLYAARFINLVRAKTPKITLYTSKAKCYLMENTPQPDFESYFYSGVKVSLAAQQIKLIEQDGRSHNFRHPVSGSEVPASTCLYIEHFNLCLQHCTNIANTLSQFYGQTDQPIFPLIIGRKPPPASLQVNSPDSSLDKENQPPPVHNNLHSFRGTIVSPAGSQRLAPTGGSWRPGGQQREASMRSDLSRRIQLPGIGTATMQADGSVRVDYLDSSALLVSSKSASVDYYQPGPVQGQGHWSSYTQADMPPQVKGKLAQIPTILQHLITAGHQPK